MKLKGKMDPNIMQKLGFASTAGGTASVERKTGAASNYRESI